MPLPQVPQNYVTAAQTAISQVRIADALVYKNSDGDQFYHMDLLGLPQYLVQDIMVTMFGRQALFLPTAFEELMNRMKPTDNYLGYRRIGREIMPNFVVKQTITGNGVGLLSVQLKVALEGGAGGRFLSRGHEIVSQSRRNFLVSAESVDTDGYQIITIVPSNGIGDLSVVGGASVEFPTNSQFGTLGVAKVLGNNPVLNPYNNFYTGFDQVPSYKMSRKYMEFKRERNFLQNALAKGSVYPFRIQDGQGEGVGLFITTEEMKELVKFFNAVNASILYGEENLNQDLRALLGNGLRNQILPELRVPYTPSEVSSKWFNDILFQYRINNPDAGQLVMVMGDALWDQLMYNLDRDFRPARRTEPNRTVKELETPFIAGPNRYERYLDTFGTNVQFIRLSALSQRAISGVRSPRNPNIGITAHDYFLFDMSPLHNVNLQTGNYEAEVDFKINFYCAKNAVDGSADALIDVNKPGLLDSRGVTISRGDVISFDEVSTRHLEMSYAVEVADRFSIMHGYLG